jgi:hypothetical protein
MALRRGEIDVALIYLGIELLSRDFYTRKLATVPSVGVLPLSHCGSIGPQSRSGRIGFLFHIHKISAFSVGVGELPLRSFC